MSVCGPALELSTDNSACTPIHCRRRRLLLRHISPCRTRSRRLMVCIHTMAVAGISRHVSGA